MCVCVCNLSVYLATRGWWLFSAWCNLVIPPWESRPPKETVEEITKAAGESLLPAAVRPRCHRILPARAGDRGARIGVERVLVVQLRQAAVASPSFCRVQGLGSPDQETVEGIGKDYG